MNARAHTQHFDPRETRVRWLPVVAIWLALAMATAVLHLRAIGFADGPGQEPITVYQGAVAAVANIFGPWAGHVVRLVDFPNAGLRGFNLSWAVALTALFPIVLIINVRVRRPYLLPATTILFAVLMCVWHGYGFYLITDGLL